MGPWNSVRTLSNWSSVGSASTTVQCGASSVAIRGEACADEVVSIRREELASFGGDWSVSSES